MFISLHYEQKSSFFTPKEVKNVKSDLILWNESILFPQEGFDWLLLVWQL